MKGSEKNHLNKIAENSLYTTFSNKLMIEYCFTVFKRFLRHGSILELGPAEGVMTKYLSDYTRDLVLVEGSDVFCRALKEQYPAASVVNELFEDFKPESSFDNIVLGHVLEHVEDPVQILSLCKGWLRPDGIILAAVPNSLSLHRQAAVIMGLLDSEDSMSELDIHHGHRRIYNPILLRKHFVQAGLKIQHFGGYWLKPVSNAQIHEQWTENMLAAFMKLGERYPDIAAENYVIASK